MYSYTHNGMMESKIVQLQVINAVNLYFLKAQNGRFDFKNKLESTSTCSLVLRNFPLSR